MHAKSHFTAFSDQSPRQVPTDGRITGPNDTKPRLPTVSDGIQTVPDKFWAVSLGTVRESTQRCTRCTTCPTFISVSRWGTHRLGIAGCALIACAGEMWRVAVHWHHPQPGARRRSSPGVFRWIRMAYASRMCWGGKWGGIQTPATPLPSSAVRWQPLERAGRGRGGSEWGASAAASAGLLA